MKILIIADDITGTLDTGAKFAAAGMPTDIIGPDDYKHKLANCTSEVAVVNSETRHMNAKDAYDTVLDIVRTVKGTDVQIVFKKTDSVLRGHVGAEIQAVCDACDGRSVFFIPAYPESGRTTVNGKQYVNGVPINESSFSEDKLDPVTQCDIAKIIKRESNLKTVYLAAGTQTTEETDSTVYIMDAVNVEDMRKNISACMSRNGQCLLLAGCAGLATVLTELISEKKSQPPKCESSRLAVICGSCNPLTKMQLDYGEDHGCARTSFSITELTSKEKPDSYFRKILDIQEVSADRKNIIIDVDGTIDQTSEVPEQNLSMAIVSGLSEAAISFDDAIEDCTLFITGGDTLSSYISKTGCERLTLLGEIFPNVVVSRADMKNGKKSRYIISKSGGFGAEDIIVKCAEFLKEGVV